jgi:DNA repair photolyase
MPFRWSLNPYMGCAHRCTFCYVRGFEARADRPSDDRYGSSIRVKISVAEVLRTELQRRSWAREEVTIGAATDAYQPCEGHYRLTRRCIEALAAADTPFSIITRGPLIVRDLDALVEASRRVRVGVHVSVPTLDDRVWRTTEPGTAPPSRRLDVVRRLAGAGVDVGVAVAPVLPGLSDDPQQLVALVRAAREAGARRIWCAVVNLRPGTREHFLAALAHDWPDELERYERLFAGRSYLPAAVTRTVHDTVRLAGEAAPAPLPPVRAPSPQPRQLTFAV